MEAEENMKITTYVASCRIVSAAFISSRCSLIEVHAAPKHKEQTNFRVTESSNVFVMLHMYRLNNIFTYIVSHFTQTKPHFDEVPVNHAGCIQLGSSELQTKEGKVIFSGIFHLVSGIFPSLMNNNLGHSMKTAP